MNIFDLDRLGERLIDLDQNDELYNCTAQLVLAADNLVTAIATNAPVAIREAALAHLRMALRPYENKNHRGD